MLTFNEKEYVFSCHAVTLQLVEQIVASTVGLQAYKLG